MRGKTGRVWHFAFKLELRGYQDTIKREIWGFTICSHFTL